jgi:hypothetical protein
MTMMIGVDKGAPRGFGFNQHIIRSPLNIISAGIGAVGEKVKKKSLDLG